MKYTIKLFIVLYLFMAMLSISGCGVVARDNVDVDQKTNVSGNHLQIGGTKNSSTSSSSNVNNIVLSDRDDEIKQLKGEDNRHNKIDQVFCIRLIQKNLENLNKKVGKDGLVYEADILAIKQCYGQGMYDNTPYSKKRISNLLGILYNKL